MRRPLYTWICFSLCLAVVLAAMGWVSLTAARLDRAEADARRQAALEENVRLVLWRKDSALAPLIAQEGARPYFSYRSFCPAERAYTRMFGQIRRGEVLVPSPLLTYESPFVRLHFQFGPDGEVTSPQAPTGNMRDLAETGYTTHEKILAAESRLAEFRASVSREALARASARAPRRAAAAPAGMAVRRPVARKLQRAISQKERGEVEWQRRASNVFAQSIQQQRMSRPLILPGKVGEGVMMPAWIGDALVLIRRVSVNGKDYIQGCWLDWPALRRELLAGISDLLPSADFEPVRDESHDKRARMLAALPVRLVPGDVRGEPGRAISPIQISLLIAWVCVLLAAIAVAVLLAGSLSLSERRGAFVSAVTHELRTPLTTFRMYTEMLADKMVPDDETRRRYLGTLRIEAERLSHLVENVLAYARLERGSLRGRAGALLLRELIERAEGRLAGRAEQAGMELAVDAADAGLSTRVQADASVVEQILLNLVDNACKYAASAEDRRIHVQVARGAEDAAVRVRDHGPGIPKEDLRRLFRPFHKSARDAAESAPGVGLGLALSRRLARRMGGDLRVDESVRDGACFVLVLAVSAPRPRSGP